MQLQRTGPARVIASVMLSGFSVTGSEAAGDLCANTYTDQVHHTLAPWHMYKAMLASMHKLLAGYSTAGAALYLSVAAVGIGIAGHQCGAHLIRLQPTIYVCVHCSPHETTMFVLVLIAQLAPA
jgi:hypothetical protein